MSRFPLPAAKLTLVPLVLTALAGCDAFQGDLQRLWFTTNLTTGTAAWTPATAVAAGTEVIGYPTRIVGEEHGLPDDARVRSFVRGARHGFTVDGVYDEFRVRTAKVARASVTGLDDRREDIALADGTTVPFVVRLIDARGMALGYDPAQLDVSATGDVSAWLDNDGTLQVAADGEQGGDVTVRYLGADLSPVHVSIANPDDIARTETICPPVPASCDTFVVADYTADGTRLYGARTAYQGLVVDAFGVASVSR